MIWLRRTQASLFIVAVLLLALYLPSPLPVDAAADCINPHCYGTAWWFGGTIGAETTMLVKPISYYPNGQQFINNEMWLANDNNSQCVGNRCWVEVGYTSGYIADLNASIVRGYFFADVRPYSNYYEHYLGAVDPIDINRQIDFRIERNASNSSTFDVKILAPSAAILAQSTSNAMAPNLIEIGMELYGYAVNATAPNSIWSYNSWIDGNHNLHYQTSNGQVYQDYPPITAYWGVPPTNSQYGGQLDVWCCVAP